MKVYIVVIDSCCVELVYFVVLKVGILNTNVDYIVVLKVWILVGVEILTKL